LKIRFDAGQQYQLDAVNAVVDVFDGQRGGSSLDLSLRVGEGPLGDEFNEVGGTGNLLTLSDETILDNVRGIQERNGIEAVDSLEGMNFTVEMETGTGKTYVYLRTIHELHKRYGFTKFVVVVPSVAIREGVLKNLEITRDHFRGLYDNVPVDYWAYDSRRVTSLRQFATSNQLQILVINIDAFNKASNVIHQEIDRMAGRRPIEFVRAAAPIVVVDEPQNMESDQSRKAIEGLNPLCTLRYSATHRNLYNLLYRLTPVDAHELGLVKQIEVDSVLDEPDFNRPYVRVEEIKATKSKVTAKLAIDVMQKNGPKRKTVTVGKNTSLFDLSGGREMYADYVVDRIEAGHRYVEFTNGVTLDEGDAQGTHKDDLMKAQVRETVKEHLEKELSLRRAKDQGALQNRLKVLSLFFIDRVANYATEDGKIRQWFVEAYEEESGKPRYKSLNLPDVENAHGGYFATDQSGAAKDTRGNTKADDPAYELIMRDKERLLSPDEPLRFIFSHSALREGWDNPNVFQICTLNETRSEVKKRQEVGRGLRIPVDETGERVFDASYNRLTIVANESYVEFAKALQTEIRDETGVDFSGRTKNARDRRTASLKGGWELDADFRELWERIKYKTRYRVEYDTDKLIQKAAEMLRDSMAPIEAPRIVIRKGALSFEEFEEKGVTTSMLSADEADGLGESVRIPDILGHIQRETELTRGTIARILMESGRLPDVTKNPQQFLDRATKEIRNALDDMMVDGIKYEHVAGQEYEMRLFEDKEITSYVEKMVATEKSIYDSFPLDSTPEQNFARDLNTREDIKFFLKLPNWFKVETPIGTYNPDWAVVKQPTGGEEKLYLVRETKSSLDPNDRRADENAKIKCGHAHFDSLPTKVDFKVVTSAAEV
jgi:type III restriction enzyme